MKGANIAVAFQGKVYSPEEAYRHIEEIHITIGSARIINLSNPNILDAPIDQRRMDDAIYSDYEGEYIVFDNKTYLLLEPPRPYRLSMNRTTYICSAINEAEEDFVYIAWENIKEFINKGYINAHPTSVTIAN